MDPKKAMKKSGQGEKKKRVFLAIQTKQEIIERYEKGMRLIDLAKEYGRNISTIGTIIKQKEALKATAPSKGLSVISKRRSAVNDEMERLLLVWIKEKEIAGDTVTEAIICAKATAIFTDLVKEDTGEGNSAQGLHQEFKASRGWFEKFKRRTGLHSVLRHGEIISLGKGMGLEVDDEDINELIQEHNEELSTKELQELEVMQHTAVQEEFKEDEEEEEEAAIIPSAQIKDILGKFHEVSEFVEKNHPEKVFTSRAIAHYDDVCLAHFRRIVKSRQKQTSLDQFFTKREAKNTADKDQ